MKKIGDQWSARSPLPPRSRWWESPAVRRHVAKKIIPGGTESGYWHVEALQRAGRTFPAALSVGCGNAFQEIALLRAGVVEHFDLFELAPRMIMDAKEAALKAGVRDRIQFHFGDFFTSAKNRPGSYDLVFWSGSLHHMFDANAAVAVSREILKGKGVFYCNEFVGANHFQYPTLEIMIANGVRSVLPREVFRIPGKDSYWETGAGRPPLEAMMHYDPSEAADSENILPAIREHFPGAPVIPLGGVVYNLALMDILTNIPEDCGLLRDLLAIDDEANDRGLFHYAFCMAEKA
ncbi:class I SAM-dependent methyltransferase [Desulfovibrio sp.]|uniref:class I SAM-dependent methyltransferase n=1 Tax=Desulfovibrio sp. TaxID=885 RepID=UPI0023D22B77|nr:class I SAM-dependent methyltransferase [Desulfovibrio sp.]MDE7241561.1 class I SAM-dependent methyltransferase [Desulfovibrio sp.]